MAHFEYKAIPAPHDGEASSAHQTAEARLANAVETRLNAMAADGWTYVRSDEFSMTGKAEKHSVLVFRREADFGVFANDKTEFGTFGTDAAE